MVTIEASCKLSCISKSSNLLTISDLRTGSHYLDSFFDCKPSSPPPQSSSFFTRRILRWATIPITIARTRGEQNMGTASTVIQAPKVMTSTEAREAPAALNTGQARILWWLQMYESRRTERSRAPSPEYTRYR